MGKGFFSNVKGGFKLGKSRPKVQGRFVRSKINSNKNVKFAKKFFKKTNKEKRTYFKRKSLIMRRKAAEKALEGGKAVKTKFKKSMTSKGFNPIKFITAIFVGRIITQLPKIISTLKAWMKKLKPVFDTLKSWVTGVVDFFKMIGTKIGDFLSSITGDNSIIDSGKKKIEGVIKNLKGVFSKMRKGFDSLISKAKGEEKNLKKDMKNVENQVASKSESGDDEKVDPFVVLEDNKDLIPPGMSGIVENEVINNPSKYNTKGKINSALSNVGVDPSKIKYRTKQTTVKGDLTTITVDGKKYPRGTSGPMNTFGGKGGSTYNNLKVDRINKNKVVTVNVPVTPKSTQTGGSSGTTTVKQDNSDSVNSNELLLTSIEK